jgi:hypothetical protein
MGAGFHFECQWSRIANNRLFSHALKLCSPSSSASLKRKRPPVFPECS